MERKITAKIEHENVVCSRVFVFMGCSILSFDRYITSGLTDIALCPPVTYPHSDSPWEG
jgi:hypothetical protein